MGTETQERNAAIDRILDWLRAERFGSLEVVDATGRLEEDADGVLALYLDVTLPAPQGDTWDLDETLELRRAVRRNVVDSGVDLPFYVRLRPDVNEPQEEDDSGSSAGLG